MLSLDINQIALRVRHPLSYRHINRATETLATHSMRKTHWDGPTCGPKAAKDRNLVILAADMGIKSIARVAYGIQEAADLLGWELNIIDGGGDINSHTAIFSKALTLQADGLFVIGFDAVEQKAGILLCQQAGIPIVAWHVSGVNGPDQEIGIFTNITTNAKEVAKATALWAYADANTNPGIIMISDTTQQIAVDKAEHIHDLLYEIGTEVIDFVDVPLAKAKLEINNVVDKMWREHGKKWTHTIAINDIYFDTMTEGLARIGVPKEYWPTGVAAGDGSYLAYQRIHDGWGQTMTIAEPLNLQGWQMVDEINRAFNKEAWSGYQAPFHLVNAENIEFDGGKTNAFDPDNQYREQYAKIWL